MLADKLVIFDCDGVLVDSEPLAAIAYVKAFAKYGLSITPDIVAQGVGMKQADILKKIQALTGQQFPPGHEGDLWDETKKLFEEQLQPTPSLISFLETLPTARCVASSSSMERIALSLRVTKLKTFFGENIFSSSMVKNGKPAPDLFLFAAKAMNTAPEQCVIIEDSHYGVQGGVAAGMTVFGYTGGGHSSPGHAEQLKAAGATNVFDNWEAIKAELIAKGFM